MSYDKYIAACRSLARAGALALALTGAAAPAVANEASATAARTFLEAGELADGATALAAIVTQNPADQEARFGLGMIRFLQAIERLSQGLYRYGLQSPESMMLPVVRMPVPGNQAPELITYDSFRGLLQTFIDDLATADAALAEASGEVKVPLDLMQVRYDANGDGTLEDGERLTALIAVLMRFNGEPTAEPSLMVTFDRADAIWLQGYSHALRGLMQFLLAHDWRETFDTTFHLFFPVSELPFATALAPSERGDLLREAAPIADLINFIHLFRWPVAEPERMIATRDHFRQVFAHSRANWDAIEAETDDDREWLPSPRQTGVFDELRVTEEQVASWRAMLDHADAVLDGAILVPHWRFTNGFNLGRVFTEPTTFDLVMWFTGPSVLPYLESGPVMTGEEWSLMLRAFEGNFATYLFWFN